MWLVPLDEQGQHPATYVLRLLSGMKNRVIGSKTVKHSGQIATAVNHANRHNWIQFATRIIPSTVTHVHSEQ